MVGAKNIPQIKMDAMSFNVNKEKTDISISGSIEADILNLFVSVFNDLVLDIIVN
jgi:hypothetical protein